MSNNAHHLIPNKDRSPEELRAMTTKGGIASGVARRKKKALKELLETILEINSPDEISAEIAQLYKLENKTLTNKEALFFSQLTKAIVGKDTQAFNAILDRLEGKPTQKQEVKTEGQQKIQVEFIN